MKIQEFTQFMEDANKDFFKNALEEKTLNPIQQLDKDCLEENIESLISLTNQKEKLEEKISYVKSAIENYAQENGVIYSDSSFTVSLVYTPKVKWKDEDICKCDSAISDIDKKIKALEKEQAEIKKERKGYIKKFQTQIKEECEAQVKSISEMWEQFSFVECEKESYHIRVDKTTKKTNHDRAWIYKK